MNRLCLKWMRAKRVVSFKVFSHTDACDLPDGWAKPGEFSLDAIITNDGNKVRIYSEKMRTFPVGVKRIMSRPLKEFVKWMDDIDEHTLFVGFDCEKFDIPLVKSKWPHETTFDNPLIDTIDIQKVSYEASSVHYDSHGRRYELRRLAQWNGATQNIIPLLSQVLAPLRIIADWNRGAYTAVMRSITADVILIGIIAFRMYRNGFVRILDDRTDKRVPIEIESPFPDEWTSVAGINESA